MNVFELLMIASLNFLAPNTEPGAFINNDIGPVGKLIDLGRLAKGRILVSAIKRGMTGEEVFKILGPPGMISGGFGPSDYYWEYGITVHYSSFDSSNKFNPTVNTVEFEAPPESTWKNFWKAVCESRLDVLLTAWDKAIQNAHELHYTVQWTAEDRVLKDKTVHQVEGFVKRPNFARVDLKDEKGNLEGIWCWHDQTFDLYNLSNKSKLSLVKPPEISEELLNQNWLGDSFLEIFDVNFKFFSLGFSKAELKERFKITLLKEDKNWVYLQLKPLNSDVQAYFQSIRVVLNPKTHLIRQVCLESTSGNRIIWDYQMLEINPTPPLTIESMFKDLPKNFKGTKFPLGLTKIESKAPDFKK